MGLSRAADHSWRADAPVLVTIGEESEADFRDAAGNLAELPHVKIETLPGQAHAAPGWHLSLSPLLPAVSRRR